METPGETKNRFLDGVVDRRERALKNNVEGSKDCDSVGSTEEDRQRLEDANRNQFFFSAANEQRKLLRDQIQLLKQQQSCAKNLSELTINGPVKQLNGECEDASDRCSSGKLIDISSHHRKSLKDDTSRDGEGQTSVVLGDDADSGSCQVCHSEVVEGCSDAVASPNVDADEPVLYVSYQSELQMPEIMSLIQKDLSEPYSIYTYRYFIHNWPQLCFLAMVGKSCVGAIVCKLDMHRKVVKRGYIAMLAVDEKYRKRKIGSNLVLKAIRAMVADGADEVVLETEITNKPALRLYENLGFAEQRFPRETSASLNGGELSLPVDKKA